MTATLNTNACGSKTPCTVVELHVLTHTHTHTHTKVFGPLVSTHTKFLKRVIMLTIGNRNYPGRGGGKTHTQLQQ